MKINRVLGQVPSDCSKKIDYVHIDWYNSCKKIQRLQSDSGVDVGISLDPESASRGLRQGDILVETEDSLVVVDVLPCDVLVISGDNTSLLPKICYEIGNRHAPFFYGENPTEFITPYDKPILVMLEKIGATVQVQNLKMNLNHNISSSHGGGHSHSHSHDDSHSHSHSESHSHSHSENHQGHSHSHSHSHSENHKHSHGSGGCQCGCGGANEGNGHTCGCKKS